MRGSELLDSIDYPLTILEENYIILMKLYY